MVGSIWNTDRKPYPRNSMVQLSTPGVTPNRGMGPREALFVKLL